MPIVSGCSQHKLLEMWVSLEETESKHFSTCANTHLKHTFWYHWHGLRCWMGCNQYASVWQILKQEGFQLVGKHNQTKAITMEILSTKSNYKSKHYLIWRDATQRQDTKFRLLPKVIAKGYYQPKATEEKHYSRHNQPKANAMKIISFKSKCKNKHYLIWRDAIQW